MASRKPAKEKLTRPKKADRGILNEEVRQRLFDAIRAGNYASVAARFAGIHPNTFWKWMKRGRLEKTGPYRDFYEEVRKSETYAEIKAVAIIQKHMEKNWRAAVTYLERKFPGRWTTRGSQRDRPTGSRKAIPQAMRLDPDVRFLGEVIQVLDHAGALSTVLGEDVAAMEQRDRASTHAQAGGVSVA